MVRLGDICNIIVGGEPPEFVSKAKNADYPYPIWGNGKEVYGYSKNYQVDKDSVAISSIGANTGAIFFHNAKFTPIIRLKVLELKNDDILSRYLFFACHLIEFNSKKSSVPNMSAADIKNKTIPIPSLSEQERIVAILDKFDALVNDLSQGIPAEIEARKKQYEYYRDKLLNFKSKVA